MTERIEHAALAAMLGTDVVLVTDDVDGTLARQIEVLDRIAFSLGVDAVPVDRAALGLLARLTAPQATSSGA
ncbi:hypothetical protein LRS13_09180 [Svornostia abyssi]|uniref:Uncharacterized protein n=1 Tax=Svornostia abyssi TaxID=2898438 RepID=A0ABY5PLV1_9ACTN|nr:hypothetical protein LRS13_09180 [Parviterribacteraceae bacterium J379]